MADVMDDQSPQSPEIRTFPNGKMGVKDAEGDWVPYTPEDGKTSFPSITNTPQPPSSSPSLTETAVTQFGLPTLGAVLGGKTPLGPIGSGIGAATGAAYGDLYGMLKNGGGNELLEAAKHPLDTLSDLYNHGGEAADASLGEAKRLGTIGATTAIGEKVLPPVLNAVGGLTHKLGTVGGGLAGLILGHSPSAALEGAAVGAIGDAAPAVAKGISWLGTPAGANEAKAASAGVLDGLSPQMRNSASMQRLAATTGKAAQKAADPAGFTDVPDYLKFENLPSTLSNTASSVGGVIKKGAGYLGQKGGEAIDALKSLIPAPEPEVGNPDLVKGVVDFAGNRASEINAGGVPYKAAMGQASKEAGWPLGQSSASTIKYGTSQIPVNSVDEILAGLKGDSTPNFSPKPGLPTSTPSPVSLADYQKAVESGIIPQGTPITEYGEMVKAGKVPPPSSTPDTSKFGPNTLGAAQKAGTRIQKVKGTGTGGGFDTREFPPGTTPKSTPQEFMDQSNKFTESQGDNSEVARIKKVIQGLLNANKG